MIDTTKLHNAMAEAGVSPAKGMPPLIPNEFVRFSISGKRSEKNGWVRVFPEENGAQFGDWSTYTGGEPMGTVWFDGRDESMLSAGEIRARRRQEDEGRRLAKEKQEQEQASAAAHAVEEWSKAQPVESHPYLTRKGLAQAHGTRRDSSGRLLVLVIDENGEPTSLQRIMPEKPPEGPDKLFLSGGKTKGGRYWLRHPDEADSAAPLVLVEGFATGASIAEALPGWPVCAAFNAGNLLPVAESIHAKHPDRLILVAGDDDHAKEKNVGRAKAEEAAQAVRGAAVFPPFGKGATGTDWNDYAQAKGLENVASLLESAASNAAQPEPVNIFGNLETPGFPTALLPETIGRFAADQGELIGTDPGVIGMGCITALAACLDDRIKLQPKRHDPTWTESARLWFAAVGDPSAKKSPALGKVMAPLNQIDYEWREEANKARKQYERDRKKWARAEKQHIEKDGPDPGPEPEMPEMRRLIYQDATVEKLARLLAEHTPRGCLVFRDELSGWVSGQDAYKNGGGKDKAAWLEAYNGGSMSVDRVGGGSTYVENWSACVLGGIQPSVINQYAGTADHDGMIQRFMVLYARPARQGVDRQADMTARDRYRELAAKLARMQPTDTSVTLSEDAHKVREMLWDRLHALMVSHPNAFLTAALGKWEGLFSRLLLVFHAVECAERDTFPTAAQVSGDTAQRVADLMTGTLLPHAVRFYNGMDTTEDKANKVARLILAKGWERFTVRRDLTQEMREFRKWKPWEADEAMQRLDSFGWIVPVPGKLNERGMPSAYAVNPQVHARFAEHAEEERRRREEVAKAMVDLAA